MACDGARRGGRGGEEASVNTKMEDAVMVLWPFRGKRRALFGMVHFARVSLVWEQKNAAKKACARRVSSDFLGLPDRIFTVRVLRDGRFFGQFFGTATRYLCGTVE